MSPLHHAVLGNRVEVVKYLLSLPAVDPNVGDGVCLWYYLTLSAVQREQLSAPACRWGPRRCIMQRAAALSTSCALFWPAAELIQMLPSG